MFPLKKSNTDVQATFGAHRPFTLGGFTMIELLSVIAIVAVLATVVIFILNPVELFRQGRDSNRLSGLAALNTAIAAYQGVNPAGSLGNANVLYISVPDPAATSSAGTDCTSLGMPALPTGWAYHCSGPSYYQKMDGTGWVPLNLASVPAAAALGTLPVDPTNTTSTGLYYTYTTDGGTNWEFTGILESTKQRTALKNNPPIATYPGVEVMGSNLALSPLYNSSGLVGYWKFDEGSGTTANDSSGMGNTGTLLNNPTWTSGPVNGALTFNGTNQYVTASNTASLTGMGALTIAAWVYTTNNGLTQQNILCKRHSASPWNSYILDITNGGNLDFEVATSSSGTVTAGNNSSPVSNNTWIYVVAIYDGSTMHVYSNGVAGGFTNSLTGTVFVSNSQLYVGACAGGGDVNGSIDDVRIYNRALSAAEIMALYNAER